MEEEANSFNSKTQATLIDEFATTKEMENLKKDLKSAPAHEQVTKWVDSLLDKGVAGLEMELEKLNNAVEKIGTVAFDANAEHNIDKEVICQDKHRVLLKDGANNYIHANYINTPNFNKHFICTQRPMITTTESFYKMIMQEQAEYIVMLGSITESTEKKCPLYFPQTVSDRPMKFGHITVKCIATENMKNENNVTGRMLEISRTGKKQHMVMHYHWKNWPERGFPEPTLTVFSLMCAVRNSKKPIVVHCSDGVGRSGVFVAVEYILEKLLRGESCSSGIDVVREIRTQRAMAVRTVSQYILLNRLLLRIFQEFDLVDMSQHLLEFIDDYDTYVRKHKVIIIF
uniref:Uncharacterized protein n=1 Tax=Setaria digitata TaxID=48799 RepID=A0A915Q0E6_9BILA